MVHGQQCRNHGVPKSSKSCDLLGLSQNRDMGKPRTWLGRVMGRVLGKFMGLEGVLLIFPFQGESPSQHPCQRSLKHPEFSQHSSHHPPQPCSGFPIALFCSRPPGLQSKRGKHHKPWQSLSSAQSKMKGYVSCPCPWNRPPNCVDCRRAQFILRPDPVKIRIPSATKKTTYESIR